MYWVVFLIGVFPYHLHMYYIFLVVQTPSASFLVFSSLWLSCWSKNACPIWLKYFSVVFSSIDGMDSIVEFLSIRVERRKKMLFAYLPGFCTRIFDYHVIAFEPKPYWRWVKCYKDKHIVNKGVHLWSLVEAQRWRDLVPKGDIKKWNLGKNVGGSKGKAGGFALHSYLVYLQFLSIYQRVIY